jgi:hypothetical protein
MGVACCALCTVNPSPKKICLARKGGGESATCNDVPLLARNFKVDVEY